MAFELHEVTAIRETSYRWIMNTCKQLRGSVLVIAVLLLAFGSSRAQFAIQFEGLDCLESGTPNGTVDAETDSLRISFDATIDSAYGDEVSLGLNLWPGSGTISGSPDTFVCSIGTYVGFPMSITSVVDNPPEFPGMTLVRGELAFRPTDLCIDPGELLTVDLVCRGINFDSGPGDTVCGVFTRNISAPCSICTTTNELFGALSGTLDPGIYTVVDTIRIEALDTLRILPGAVLNFAGPYPLRVYGTLLAVGTETDSIVFTTDTLANPGRWRGIRFHDNLNRSVLAYAVIELGHAMGFWPDSEGGGVFCNQSSPQITHCAIRNNRAFDGGGIGCEEGSSPLISECLISNNASPENFGGGMKVVMNCDPIVSRCTFSGNVADVGGAIYSISFSHVLVTNSIFVNNSASAQLGSAICAEWASWVHVDHSDFWGTGDDTFYGNLGAGTGDLISTNPNGDSSDVYYNIFLDPLFVNPASGDFHLTANSPCIDAGDPALYDPDCTISDVGALYYFHLAQPESLVISENYPHVDLCWSVVDSTDCAAPSPIRSYVVWYEAEENEDWNFLAVTTDTCYRHAHVLQFAPNSHFYQVVATDYDPVAVNRFVNSAVSPVKRADLERRFATSASSR